MNTNNYKYSLDDKNIVELCVKLEEALPSVEFGYKKIADWVSGNVLVAIYGTNNRTGKYYYCLLRNQNMDDVVNTFVQSLS